MNKNHIIKNNTWGRKIALIMMIAFLSLLLSTLTGFYMPKIAASTPTEEVTPEPTPTEGIDPDPTPTDEVTPDPTPTPTEEITPEPTPTPTPTDEVTLDPTPTPTEDITPEPTPTEGIDPDPSPTPTPTEEVTPEPTPTEGIDPDPSPTPTPTEEVTPVPTPTEEIDPDPSPTPTPTEEVTPEPTPTEGIDPDPTPTPTEEVTPIPSPTEIPFPQRITSSMLYVDQISLLISRVSGNLTADEFLSFLNEREYVRIYSGSNEITGTQTVGTGMTVLLMRGASIIRSYTVVVTGDVNGDGKITLTDFVQIQSHLLKKSTFDGWFLMAADLNGGGVTITDFVMMQSHLLGKESIIPRIH